MNRDDHDPRTGPAARLESADQLLLQRFVDGELPPAERAAFEQRLQAEPALAEARTGLAGLRAAFAAGRDRTGWRGPAPAGFTGGVLAAVRADALGARSRAQQGDDDTIRLCRRILLIAAAVAVAALLLHTWSRTFRTPAELLADPVTSEREIERLDALIRAGAPVERR